MTFRPLSQISSFSNYDFYEDVICKVCHEEIDNDADIYAHDKSNDPHTVHSSCIPEWTNQKAHCPECLLRITHVNGIPVTGKDPMAGDPLECKMTLLEELALSFTNHIPNIMAMPVRNRENLLVSLAESGSSMPTVLLILLGTPTIAPPHIGLTAADAINQNNMQPVSEDARGRALIPAANKGHVSIVRAILASGSISSAHFKTAFIVALGNDFVGVVEALLENRTISEEIQVEGLKRAVGDLNLMELILQNRPISMQAKQLMIDYVKLHPHLTHYQAMLDLFEEHVVPGSGGRA